MPFTRQGYVGGAVGGLPESVLGAADYSRAGNYIGEVVDDVVVVVGDDGFAMTKFAPFAN